MYLPRIIDSYLKKWSENPSHKPLLLRGARQVGKSTAVRHLGETFDNFLEINFERQPEYNLLFKENLDVKRIIRQIEALAGQKIIPGTTLLFLDEIQFCKEAIMALRFFKEDLPELHVIAAGSLLEFALTELPTYGTGRIHSMFMYPMSFDEFLEANQESALLNFRNSSTPENPLPTPLYNKLVSLMRTFMMIGGMPEVVAKWVETNDFLQCQEIQDDLLIGYEDDFPKYSSKVKPGILRQTLRSVAVQCSKKFSYSEVGGGYRIEEIKNALELLILAGLCIPVVKTSANGLPLGSEADNAYRKILFMDPGLQLRLLNMSIGNISDLTTLILTGSAPELINKGPMGELMAGLEMIKYKDPNRRHELYYWQRAAKKLNGRGGLYCRTQSSCTPYRSKSQCQGWYEKFMDIHAREKNKSRGKMFS